jgi:hypothetical protein
MTPEKINEIAERWTYNTIQGTEWRNARLAIEGAIKSAIYEAINVQLAENTQAALDSLRSAGQPKSIQQPPMVEALGCTVLEAT